MQDHAEAEVPALAGANHGVEFHLDLYRVFFGRQLKQVAEPLYMGVNGQTRKPQRHAADHIRCLAPDAG